MVTPGGDQQVPATSMKVLAPDLCRDSEAASATFAAISGAFLIIFLIRILLLRREPVKVRFNGLGFSKLTLSIWLALVLIGKIRVLTSVEHVDVLDLLRFSIPVAPAIGLTVLSLLEHGRSVKPSTLITIYLLATIGCDVAFIGQDYGRDPRGMLATDSGALLAVELAIRMLLLILESQNKAAATVAEYKPQSPEDAAGVFSITIFWWMKDLLALGKKHALRVSDTPPLNEHLRPTPLRSHILQGWDKRTKPESSVELLKVLASCLRRPFVSAAIPRIWVTIFQCSQPIIVNRAIDYVSSEDKATGSSCYGYQVLGAAMVVYFGLAISGTFYRRRLANLQIMVKTSLVHLVYDKALKTNTDRSDAGRIVTIMTTDIEGISDIGSEFHETWGQFFELAISLVLLSKQVGWLWPLPVALVFFGSRVSRYVAQNIRSRTKSWNNATQSRISALSTILGSARSVKAMGLAKPISRYVCNLRDKEIDSSKQVRWMNVIYNASANALGIFTPVITVALFAILAAMRGERLDAKTAFTSSAILAVVTHPANMIMTIVPRVVGSLANVDRIQDFLLEPPRVDGRKIRPVSEPSADEMAISVDNVAIQVQDRSAPILNDISFKVPKGHVTMCGGPTGCGKTTLARAILGESCPSVGTVSVSSARVAYCDQKAWIPTGTIKDIVCAFEKKADEEAYKQAIRLCCLEHDLATLPDGDDTLVGSRGVNLSGGQRQRVALARLIYSKASIAVLDDPFSALDGATENKVVDNLLGRDGWFRRSHVTAFIVSNAAQHFHLADQIILIENGRIEQQGKWFTMQNRTLEMQKFSFHETEEPTEAAARIMKQKAKAQADEDAEQDLHRTTGDISLYLHYLKSVGVANLLLLTVSTAGFAFFSTFIQYWLKLWTESDGTKTTFYIAGYFVLAFVAWFSTSCQMGINYILLAPRSGSRLHKSLLTTILGAPLIYFSSTDVGVILNRFSQDISLVDRQLPNALSALIVQILKMIVQIVLVVQVQRMLLFALPACVVLVYFVQRVYLRPSRQLRVLELESHSALYSWFLETTEGILSIRAFNWTQDATDKNVMNLEFSLRPEYALKCLQNWLKLVLELIVSCVAVGIIAIATVWKGKTAAADIGMSLNIIILTNATLVRLVQSFTQLEVSLGAIARLRDIETHTAKEDQPWEDGKPHSSWPQKGHVQVSHFNAGYVEERNILHDVNLEVKQGQKLVICGRTGSGKSTMILGLLRLIESTGTISVDDEPFDHLERDGIRSRCFITVPQEPFFLPESTLSFNLDPDELASDNIICGALRSVGLWELLSNDGAITEPELLAKLLSSLRAMSVGQLQLLALARAIVKKSVASLKSEFRDVSIGDSPPRPILVLDEATSSLDPTTEETIYDIIENEFVANGHTVIIIAHRISVLGRKLRAGHDKVAWLQDGRIMKVGDYEDIARFAVTPSPNTEASEVET